MVNKVIIIGNVGSDPEVRVLDGGRQGCQPECGDDRPLHRQANKNRKGDNGVASCGGVAQYRGYRG